MPICAGKVSKPRCAVLARTNQPVINHPHAVLKTGRAANVERLRGMPGRYRAADGHVAAASARFFRSSGGGRPAAGFSFPFLRARAGLSHRALFSNASKICRSLTAAAAEFPGDDLCLIEQLDARDGDGMFRKCRVMIIDRKIYPLHLAISRNWKVHYFRADMANPPDNRAKDAAFLDDMASFIGARGMAALRADQRGARSRLLRGRFRGECRRRHFVVRSQRDHGHGAAFGRPQMGLSAAGVRQRLHCNSLDADRARALGRIAAGEWRRKLRLCDAALSLRSLPNF